MSNRMMLVLGVILGFLSAAGVRSLLSENMPMARGDTVDNNSGWIGATGQVANGRSVLYLFDTSRKHLLVYDATEGRALKLVAARKCEYDTKIVDFGGTGSSVMEVKRQAESADNAKDEEKKPK